MQTNCANLFTHSFIFPFIPSYNIQEVPVMDYALSWVTEPEKVMNISMRSEGTARLVECLPSMHKALGSVLSTI